MDSSKSSNTPIPQVELTFERKIEESLKCGICFDLILRASTLVPCMHTFCGKCISEWNSRTHPNCPACNQSIEKVYKNHLVDNQVEIFLYHYPNKSRSPKEIEEWNTKNHVKYDVPLIDQRILLDSIIEAIERNDTTYLRELLAKLHKPTDVNELSEMDMTPLMWASLHGHHECIKLLCDIGATLNERDIGGCTSLMAACTRGHKKAVEVLCQRGADVNIRNHDGATALMLSCNKGHEACIQTLLQYHATTNIQQNDGWTAVMWTIHRGRHACLKLLCEHGADINQKCGAQQITALIYACLHGYHECVSLLCQYGALVNQPDVSMKTAMMACSEYGHPECVEILCQYQADVNALNEYGWTALMIASYKGHKECIEILCKYRSNINHQDREGKTALMLACAQSHFECVQILLENNADVSICNFYNQSCDSVTTNRLIKQLLHNYSQKTDILGDSHSSNASTLMSDMLPDETASDSNEDGLGEGPVEKKSKITESSSSSSQT